MCRLVHAPVIYGRRGTRAKAAARRARDACLQILPETSMTITAPPTGLTALQPTGGFQVRIAYHRGCRATGSPPFPAALSSVFPKLTPSSARTSVRIYMKVTRPTSLDALATAFLLFCFSVPVNVGALSDRCVVALLSPLNIPPQTRSHCPISGPSLSPNR